VGYEYDPHNKLRHTTYWFETDKRAEWPLSENAKEEEPERDGEPFDYQAVARKFYMDVEGDGSLAPQEIIMKVTEQPYLLRFCLFLTFKKKGLTELQTKLANLILGLKTQPELDALANTDQTTQVNGHLAASAPPATWSQAGSGPWDQSSSPPVNGAVSGATWSNSPGVGAGGWNSSPTPGVWESTSPNPANAASAWGTGSAGGWTSPQQQSAGWNV
jgi:DNA-directed RNA polymerase II subunit RPB3